MTVIHYHLCSSYPCHGSWPRDETPTTPHTPTCRPVSARPAAGTIARPSASAIRRWPNGGDVMARQTAPTAVTMKYDLFDLPTAQHKAGLAGLLLQILHMKG